jgi:hypothetical protein
VTYQILNRFTNAVIFELELPVEIAAQSPGRQLGYAVKKALEARANLADANLTRANLADAYLAGANLADAYLAGANLAGANLADANNVPETNGTETITEPTDRAERQRARAERYRARNPDVPIIENLDAQILEIVDSGKGRLKMDTWHTCETTHCRAGWAVTLAGDPGKTLENQYGPQEAGRRIYLASAGRAPWFFGDNETALADMREQAALLGAP